MNASRCGWSPCCRAGLVGPDRGSVCRMNHEVLCRSAVVGPILAENRGRRCALRQPGPFAPSGRQGRPAAALSVASRCSSLLEWEMNGFQRGSRDHASVRCRQTPSDPPGAAGRAGDRASGLFGPCARRRSLEKGSDSLNPCISIDANQVSRTSFYFQSIR